MQTPLETSILDLFMLGKGLSVLAVVLVGAAIWSAWRRAAFPAVAYGGVSLSPRRLRWVWILVLVGAFGFGVNEDPIAISTQSMEDSDAAEAASVQTSVGLTLWGSLLRILERVL